MANKFKKDDMVVLQNMETLEDGPNGKDQFPEEVGENTMKMSDWNGSRGEIVNGPVVVKGKTSYGVILDTDGTYVVLPEEYLKSAEESGGRRRKHRKSRKTRKARKSRKTRRNLRRS